MKILRKAFYVLPSSIIVLVLLSIFSAIGVSAADYTWGYYTYSISNGEATITDVDTNISGEVTVPSTLGGYSVNSIGKYAFQNCANVTKITLPKTITSIGNGAFELCTSLNDIVIPNGVTSLGSGAFSGCTNLASCILPEGITTLKYGLFQDCNSLASITIPSTVTHIESNVFDDCTSLTELFVPKSVTTIETLNGAFRGCSSLESIAVEAGNPKYHANGNCLILTASKCLILGCKNSSIPADGSVTSVEGWAFFGCSGLTYLDFPSTIVSIGSYAFQGCSGLETVNIHDLKAWCELSLADGAYPPEAEQMLLDGVPLGKNLVIPEGTTTICAGAFKECGLITELVIPESVKSIENSAFYGCNSLTDVCIYGSPSISQYAFCVFTSSYSSPKYTFYATPKRIDNYAFGYSLPTVYCYADNDVVRNFAQKKGLTIYLMPCKNGCNYKDIISDDFLLSEGSCTAKSVYYKSCSDCKHASDTLTFEGDYVHHYTTVIDDRFLVKNATCTEAAVYAKSCRCGEKNEDLTFSYGSPLGHTYDDECDSDCNACYELREAPHALNLKYSKDADNHWRVCNTCNNIFCVESHKYDNNQDVTCDICGYERIIFVVTYDANGGENAPSVSYVPLGAEATVSSNVPTKDNFVFVGWATNVNGSVEYEVGDALNLSESITLYAVWKAECQECGGTGKQHTTRTCTSCKSGYVYSSSCYYCYGRGKYSTGDMSCSNCYGSGQVKDPYGSGKYVNCFMCGGDGLVPDYQTCYHCRSKCTICNGSTKITDYFDCENCDALGCFDSFEVHYDANGGSGTPNSQTMGGKLDTLSETIPSREGFVFVGWNTLTDNNAVYQPGATYCNGEVTFYAMWAPACHSCAGEGHFTAGNICGRCNGNGTYSVIVKTCNSCRGNHVVTYVTGYGEISYCSNCGSTSVKTSTQTETCSNCTNGIVGSTYECEDCEGSGYVQTYPKALSFTDSKVALLKIDGMEYSIDGINWQDSNVFTELLPGTGYSFYQRIKATENAPFGFVSAPLLLRTDKADNEDVPSTPLVLEVTAESIRVDLISGCEYSIDGVNWQSGPLFINLDCATNYTVYARFAETDTHYASQAISYTVVRTEKGTVSAPSMPTLVAVGRDRIILQKLEGYEYSIDGIHWQSSNAFLGLESKTNYFIYCRFAATDRYYASAPSEALTAKTLAESEVGPTYQITFQDEYGNILSQASYELYDEIVIPSTLKESDLTYTYTFLRWDKPISEFCMGEAIYTAAYEKKYIDYTVVFKDYNGDVISTNTYHYGDAVVVPSDPTRVADNTYTYAFAGWDTSVATTCSGSVTYTATYTPTYIEYTVKFVDEDNTPISTRTYHYGDTIVAPTNPTKASDNTYNYTFAGWDKAVTNCDGDTTYKATYTSAYINYTVVFKNYNDDVISSKTYHYGDAVVVPVTPKKPSDENYCYVFVGWDKSVTNCFGDAVYTAKFTASDLPIVTVNNSSARANETVVVNILLSGAPNLGSLAISNILYDTSAFELVSVDWKVADAILSNWDAATGKGALALSTAKDINGTIISLTFKVKAGTADGNYPVSCTVTSQECDFKNVAGQLTVYSVTPGDVDGNESVDKDDAIYLLMHSFFPEDYPINQEADYNGNGMVDKDDAIHLLMYTFFPDDYPLAPAPAAVTITTTVERKKGDEDEE